MASGRSHVKKKRSFASSTLSGALARVGLLVSENRGKPMGRCIAVIARFISISHSYIYIYIYIYIYYIYVICVGVGPWVKRVKVCQKPILFALFMPPKYGVYIYTVYGCIWVNWSSTKSSRSILMQYSIDLVTSQLRINRCNLKLQHPVLKDIHHPSAVRSNGIRSWEIMSMVSS